MYNVIFIELNTRVNFLFSKSSFLKNNSFHHKHSAVRIVPTSIDLFQSMNGAVIPKYFWNNEKDFIKNGIGFSLLYYNIHASMAYSAFIHDDFLETGIETVPEFRGMGFAKTVCAALINYCINNNLIPIWSCRYENKTSFL